MVVRGKRVVPRCQAVECQTTAKQSCVLCAHACCAAHGRWAKSAQIISSLRGPTPPDASVWLCVTCATSMGVATPLVPHLRRRVVLGAALGASVPVG